MQENFLLDYLSFDEDLTCLPVSFRCNGMHWRDTADDWTVVRNPDSPVSMVLRSEMLGLRIAIEVRRFPEHCAVDWVCRIRYEGTGDSPLIEDFMALSLSFPALSGSDDVVVRWSKGDECCCDAFMPHDELLGVGERRRFAPIGGRSANRTFPYFSVSSGEVGYTIAIGWSGQWATEFTHEDAGAFTVTAGMETTRFRLHPGEEVRTPRILLQQWVGAFFDVGHNAFRQLMLDEYIPKNNGATILPPVAYNSAASLCMAREDATIQNQQAMARKAAELGCEYYWLDAYWFPTPWGERAGDWYPRPEDFPDGLRPLADTVHELGMKFVLWFEPERVMADTDWGRRYSDHVLRIPDAPQGLLNLGAPEVQEMVIDFLDTCVKEWDVDIYRQDFNMEPLPYWQAADEPDRQGIAEMKYIAGFYRIWDGLLERNPGLMIDNCASGGRRIDIETCSRALPLWRSDCNEVHRGEQGPGFYPEMALADQVQVSGLSLYVPYHAGPVWSTEPYCWRSAMATGASMYGYLDGFDPLVSRAAIAELQGLRPLWAGNIYVITPISLDDTTWHAFQLHRQDLGKGCLLAFRRAACTEDALAVNLREIDPDAMYRVEVRDNAYGPGVFHELPGAALANYVVRTDQHPAAVLIIYELKSSGKSGRVRAKKGATLD